MNILLTQKCGKVYLKVCYVFSLRGLFVCKEGKLRVWFGIFPEFGCEYGKGGIRLIQLVFITMWPPYLLV